MTDKKIITLAIILAALVIGAGWYYSKYSPQPAAILPSASPSASPLNLESGIIVGSPNAPVTMEEYTSFLCSHCQQFANTSLKQIEENYVKTGKVKLVIYAYPVELGQAALCAQEQNKFLEYHDYLFTHQIVQEQDIKDFAVNVGLDKTQFDTCFDSGKYKDKTQKWLEQGQARGVSGTPTFFINGQQIVGAVSYEEIQKVIEEKLVEAQ